MKPAVEQTERRPTGAKSQAGSRPAARCRATDSLRRLLPAVLYRLGRTQVELKDWAAAAVTLDRLLAEFPDNPYRREARYLRAESAFSKGMPPRPRKASRPCSPSRRPPPIPRGGPGRSVEADPVLDRLETLERRAGRRPGAEGRAGRGRPVDRRAGLRDGAGLARAGPARRGSRGVSGVIDVRAEATWPPRPS